MRVVVVTDGPGDVWVEDRPEPTILTPSDAILHQQAIKTLRRTEPVLDNRIGVA